MGNKWPNISLDSICKIKSGKRLPKGHELVDTPTNYPYIRLVDVNGGAISSNDLKYLTADTHQKIKRYIVNENDVCLAIVGHTIGMVFFVDKKWDNVNLTENAARITEVSNKFNPKYIYYYLSSPYGQTEIISRTVGSAQGKLPLYNIKSIEIPELPRHVQDWIVNILDSLDQKITLNRQINQTLEQMAQTLFKSWFVDFDPVIDNALDAGNEIPEPLQARAELRQQVRASQDFQPLPTDILALFPAEFEESELGWVPKGWAVTRLENILELAYGKALKKTDRIAGNFPVYGSGGVDGTHHKSLVKGPGIIVGRKGTVGSLYWESEDFYPIDTVFYVKPKQGYSLDFCFQLLKTLGLEYMNTDAAVPGLNRNNAYRLECISPNSTVLEYFSCLIGQYQNRINVCLSEINSLTQLRDTLLPKLISGELRLDDLPDEVVTAANE